MTLNSRAIFLGMFAASLLMAVAPGHTARTPAPLEHRQSRGSLFEWSPLVQQIQQLLIEFDLLAGRANGWMTPETQQAIRAYQKQSDRAVTGDADEDLLQHMETVGRAETLKKRLARARDQQVERARNALDGSAATRDLLRAEKPRLTAVPQNGIDRCLRAPEVGCLLAGAIGAVSNITREDYRDWALREVVRAQATAGDMGQARETMKQLGDLRLVLVSMREAAAALAEAGFRARAQALTETIPDPWNRSRALLAIALADIEDDQSIETLISLLPQLEDRAGAIEIGAELLAELAERGDQARSEAVAAMTKSLLDGLQEGSRIALGTLAAAYARADRSDEAIATLDRLGESGRDTIALAETAVMLARRGDLKAALATADRLRTARLYVLAVTKIASVLRQRGHRQDAGKLLGKAEAAIPDIERVFAADTAWSQIATIWSDLGEFERAIASIGKIKSRGLAAQTMWDLVTKSRGADNGLFAQAVTATDRIESTFDRAAAFARAARDLADVGQDDKARRTFDHAVREAKAIRNSWWQARILSLLATVLTKL